MYKVVLTSFVFSRTCHDVEFYLFLFRNLSACGSHEICNLLVEQDVMTPLSALIQKVWNMLSSPLAVVCVCVYPKACSRVFVRNVCFKT
jgi:hypothetical protein